MSENFKIILQESGIDLTHGQSVRSLENKIQQYFAEILKWNQKINLVSRDDTHGRLPHHFFDSLHYVQDLPKVLPEGLFLPGGLFLQEGLL